jgi:hypothetical protein
MAKCLSSDDCFQCSPISPSLLFLNKWCLPFYQESCLLAETATIREGKANEVGQTRPGMGRYKKPIDESWKSIDTNPFLPGSNVTNKLTRVLTVCIWFLAAI